MKQIDKKSSFLEQRKVVTFQDLSNYVILFDSVFTHKAISESFYKFLKKEFATENYDFITDFDKLCRLDQPEDLVRESLLIYDTYLADGSKREVNVAGPQRERITNLITKAKQRDFPKKWKISCTPSEVFLDCVKSLKGTLQVDSFKRYIRTQDFLHIIPDYLDDHAVCVSRVSYQFNYVDEDFHHQYVADKDFEFMKMLMVDGFNWEVVGSKNEFNSLLTSYFSTVNYLVGCKFTFEHAVNAVKYETVLNYPFHRAVGLYPLENFLAMDPNSNRIDTLKYMPKDESFPRDHYVSRTTCQFPLLDYRVYNAVVSTDWDPKRKRLIQILKSCDTEEKGKYLEKRKERVCAKKGTNQFKDVMAYNMFNFMGIIIEKLDEFRTKYCQIMLCGLGGWCDNVQMAKMITHDRGVKSKRSLIRKLEEIPSDLTWDYLCERYKNDSMMKELMSLEGLKDEFPSKNVKIGHDEVVEVVDVPPIEETDLLNDDVVVQPDLELETKLEEKTKEMQEKVESTMENAEKTVETTEEAKKEEETLIEKSNPECVLATEEKMPENPPEPFIPREEESESSMVYPQEHTGLIVSTWPNALEVTESQ